VRTASMLLRSAIMNSNDSRLVPAHRRRFLGTRQESAKPPSKRNGMRTFVMIVVGVATLVMSYQRLSADEARILVKIPDPVKVRHISAALSPDQTLLATGTLAEKELRIWDVKTGKLKTTLTGHSGEVRAVAFSPDGKLLVSASGEVKVWDV